jgi:Cu-processing system permease protein
MISPFAVVHLCAKQEVTIAVRSRWVQVFAVVFAVLALLVASSGYILSGGSGMQDFSRTAVSLVQLVLLLVPLASLVFGVLALSPERGAAELLYSQPISRAAVLAGKLLGLFQALAAAQAVGFGAAGLVVFSQVGDAGAAGFVGAVAGSLVLTAVFLGVAAFVSSGVGGRRRARALATALAIWFVAVVLFDVAALGVASMLRSGSASRLLMIAVLVNPVDAVRTAALLVIDGTAAFGASSLALFRFTHGAAGAAALIALSLVTWIVVPVFAAAWRLVRMDV